jgi:spermidine/putrescine transport system substrate-binding protein
MKRYTWIFFTFIILSLIVGACTQAEPPPAVDEGADEPEVEVPPAKPFEGQTLRLLTWEGYVPDAVKQAFEDETGAKVEITYISNNGELTSKLVATGGEGYDLASPSVDNVAAAQTTYQIYQPLDISRIPNFSNAVPSMVQAVKEMSTVGEEYYSIPFTWGTSVLIVNTALVDEEINSYAQFCDPKYEGRVTHRYRYPGIVAASYGLGHDLFAQVDDPVKWREILEDTLEYMIDCKSNIKAYWTTRQENIDLFLSEEAWIGKGWDGTGWLLSMENPNIKAIAPKEGALGWIDTFTLPAGAENIDLAYAFIEFNYRPEVAGMVISGGGFLSAIDGSADYLDATQATLINETFPPEAIDNINWYPALTPELEEINSQIEERLRAAVGE